MKLAFIVLDVMGFPMTGHLAAEHGHAFTIAAAANWRTGAVPIAAP